MKPPTCEELIILKVSLQTIIEDAVSDVWSVSQNPGHGTKIYVWPSFHGDKSFLDECFCELMYFRVDELYFWLILRLPHKV